MPTDWNPSSDWRVADPEPVNLSEAIGRLLPKKRGKGRLPPAASRGAIGESVSEAVPSAAEPGGAGVNWPLTEISRVSETVRVYDPADASVFIDIERATQVTFQDAGGEQVVMNLTYPS